MSRSRDAFPRLLLFALLSLGACGLPAVAATLSVPSQYTIQAAVNAAQNSDTVLLADGTYTGPGPGNVDLGGRNITVTSVTSVNGPARTILDCGGYASSDRSGNQRGFTLHISETSAVIRGLTIQNGYESTGSNDNGGGIFNSGVGLTVRDCILRHNTVGTYGSGGGLYNYMPSGRTVTVTNCTFTGNTARYSGGTPANLDAGENVTLLNDILYGDAGGEICTFDPVTAICCDVKGGYLGNGNLDADPAFANAPTDLHLQPGSPCLDAGFSNGAPATTLDGRTRPNPPSLGTYDIWLTSTTTLASSPHPSVVGQSVTFTATVTSNSPAGTGSGTVTFFDGPTALGTGPLTGGVATLTTSALGAGGHPVTAAYGGDSNNAASTSGALTQTVPLPPGFLAVAPPPPPSFRR